MRNYRLWHSVFLCGLWCCATPLASALEDDQSTAEKVSQESLPGLHVIVYSVPREEGQLGLRHLGEARNKEEQTLLSQPQSKLGGMRKGLFLAAAVTIVLVVFPLLGRLITMLRRTRKMRESWAPRERLPALQPKLAKNPSAPGAVQPGAAEQFAQQSKQLPPPILGDRPFGKSTPALPVHRTRPPSPNPSSVRSKDQLLKTAAFLSSAPLPTRMRLITDLELLVDKLHRETLDKTSGSPW